MCGKKEQLLVDRMRLRFQWYHLAENYVSYHPRFLHPHELLRDTLTCPLHALVIRRHPDPRNVVFRPEEAFPMQRNDNPPQDIDTVSHSVQAYLPKG